MAQKKPTVYVDTNVISVLYYRGGDIRIAHQQLSGWEWWDNERKNFRLLSSAVVREELAQGTYKGKEKAIALARKLPRLPLSAIAWQCTQTYLKEKIVPENQEGDAAHLALCTAHSVDYLLTWNHAHLVNVETQRKLNEINQRLGLRSPVLASPETMPKVALGHQIRRPEA